MAGRCTIVDERLIPPRRNEAPFVGLRMQRQLQHSERLGVTRHLIGMDGLEGVMASPAHPHDELGDPVRGINLPRRILWSEAHVVVVVPDK